MVTFFYYEIFLKFTRISRGEKELCAHIVGATSGDPSAWQKICYMVIDSPSHSSSPLEDRMNMLRTLIPSNSTHIKLVENTVCRDDEHLQELYSEVTDMGGAGLVLRKPGSLYEPVHSSSMIRINVFISMKFR
jgi:DNA ligase-1